MDDFDAFFENEAKRREMMKEAQDAPLEKMPLYINSEFEEVKWIAIDRLKEGK